MGYLTSGLYFNSKSKHIRAIALLMILADAVFEISSTGAKRYLSCLWSVCGVNRLSGRNFLYPMTTKRTASASRLSSFDQLELISSKHILLDVLLPKEPRQHLCRGVSIYSGFFFQTVRLYKGG